MNTNTNNPGGVRMTQLQDDLRVALRRMDNNLQKDWEAVVKATNELKYAIDDEKEYYDSSFPPEILRLIDCGALNTGWIYDRLNDKKRNKQIKKALGYNV